MLHINRLPTILVLVALMFSACQPIVQPVQPVPIATPQPTPVPSPATKPAATIDLQMGVKSFQFTSQALAGNLLGDPSMRTIYVLLPPSYATSDRHYPVVYVLPWGNGDSSSNVWGFKTAIETLLKTAEVNNMILVFPDGTNKLGGSQFGNSPTIGDYETYITQELVQKIDADYRTLPARDSRGIAGCSNGGAGSMRLALKYPNVYGAVTTSGDTYDWTPERNATLVMALTTLRELPKDADELFSLHPLIGWYIQVAAGAASNPKNPPLYLDMPFRIVNGQGEIVPEVAAKIVDLDSAHEAQRYIKQALRLHGILIQPALHDSLNPIEIVRGFDQLLTTLGIEHEYVEENAGHCDFPWESTSLKFLSAHLVFEKP